MAAYELVIQEHIREMGKTSQPRQLVFLDSTEMNDPCPGGSPPCPDTITKQLLEHFAGEIQRGTIQDFLTKNQTPMPLNKDFRVVLPGTFITVAEEKDLFTTPGQDPWRKFYSAYPGTRGILALSQAGFNLRLNQAVVYSEITCGFTCGGGFFNLLDKRSGKWLLVDRWAVWVS